MYLVYGTFCYYLTRLPGPRREQQTASGVPARRRYPGIIQLSDRPGYPGANDSGQRPLRGRSETLSLTTSPNANLVTKSVNIYSSFIFEDHRQSISKRGRSPKNGLNDNLSHLVNITPVVIYSVSRLPSNSDACKTFTKRLTANKSWLNYPVALTVDISTLFAFLGYRKTFSETVRVVKSWRYDKFSFT